MKQTISWYESSYRQHGFSAQRKYPNENLVSVIMSIWSGHKDKKSIKILETGCGSGANLWFLAREGFDAYGIDVIPHALELCANKLLNEGLSARLECMDMSKIDFDFKFDMIFDIVSNYCLDEEQFQEYLNRVNNHLKSGGYFFMSAWTDQSTVFTNHAPAILIDEFRINGIYREDSPFYGNFYPFRFYPVEYLKSALSVRGLEIVSLEFQTRTYNGKNDMLEIVNILAKKL